MEALEESLKIITDCHPYNAFCTGLGAAVPEALPGSWATGSESAGLWEASGAVSKLSLDHKLRGGVHTWDPKQEYWS